MISAELLIIDVVQHHSKQKKLEIGNALFEECVRIGANIGTIDKFKNPTRLGVYKANKDVIWICNGLKERSRNRVICHEMIHWTGHTQRLNRYSVTMHLSSHQLNPVVKDQLYAVEEVIAELGSIGLCIQLNLPWKASESATYINNYLSRCPEFENKQAFFHKVSKASVEYVFNKIYKSTEDRLILLGKMQEWLDL